MTNHTEGAPLVRIARLAGLLFLLTFIFPTITWVFVSSKFIEAGNAAASANKIMAGEFLFRVGILADLIRSALAVVFAVVLYAILKSINRNVALFAVFLKVMEAVLVAVMALGHYSVLLILKGQASSTEIIRLLVGSFVNASFDVSALVLIFHGLNSIAFLSLFFQSKYVPRKLAGFGIISYALVFLYGLLLTLAPHAAIILPVQIICFLPSILLELILGSWLLIKGVNAQ